MTKRQAWRYKCDHCGKTSSSAGHMRRHELGCTANPSRRCGFCGEQWPRPHLMERAKTIIGVIPKDRPGSSMESYYTARKAAAESILREAGRCPGCALAAIRQLNMAGNLNFSFRQWVDDWQEETAPPPDTAGEE